MGTMGDPIDTWDTLEEVYLPAADKGELPLRVFAMVPLPTWYACSAYTTVVRRSMDNACMVYAGWILHHIVIMTPDG